MLSRLVALALLLVTPFLVSCSSSSSDSSTAVPQPVASDTGQNPSADDRGQAAFAQGMCAKCHGEDGSGTERAPDLTDDEWVHCDGSVAGIRTVLVTGVAKEDLVDPDRPFKMNPATNLVAETELDALSTYVKSFSQQ